MAKAQNSPNEDQSRGSDEQQSSGTHSAASSMRAQASSEHDAFAEDDIPEDDATGWSAQFVAPFQPSGPLPPTNQQAAPASTNMPGVPAQGRTRLGRFPILKVVLISALIGLAAGFLALSVFAQPASHLNPTAKNPPHGSQVAHSAPTARPKHTVQAKPTPTKTTATPPATPQGDWIPSAQTLQQLGWTAVGLSTADAIEAERTAWTFTDREMSLDWRNVGTREEHGGTFTAAVFLLTPNARVRFFQNDVRVMNDVLFDRMEQEQLVQEMVNAQPRLVQFQVEGQQEFAWVDVSFELWQSRLDPQTESRVEGLKLDPVTHQPRIYHMIVLLLRVPPGTQGANAPMGGTGWLVSTYALNPPGGSLPAIIQPA